MSLGQHDGDGIRYAMHLSAPKGGSAQMLRDPAGGWVSWEDYAILKDENKILTMLVEKMQRDFYESMTDEEKAIYEANKQKFTNLFYNAIKRKMN